VAGGILCDLADLDVAVSDHRTDTIPLIKLAATGGPGRKKGGGGGFR
jgi:hypothetical protein